MLNGVSQEYVDNWVKNREKIEKAAVKPPILITNLVSNQSA